MQICTVIYIKKNVVGWWTSVVSLTWWKYFLQQFGNKLKYSSIYVLFVNLSNTPRNSSLTICGPLRATMTLTRPSVKMSLKPQSWITVLFQKLQKCFFFILCAHSAKHAYIECQRLMIITATDFPLLIRGQHSAWQIAWIMWRPWLSFNQLREKNVINYLY